MEKSDSKEGKDAEKRRDAGIARMLNTPPKPHKDMKKGASRSPKATASKKGK